MWPQLLGCHATVTAPRASAAIPPPLSVATGLHSNRGSGRRYPVAQMVRYLSAPPTYRSGSGRPFQRPLFGALGLRPPAAQHTEAEGQMLRAYAAQSQVTVEIGVAEGGSAWEAASVMPSDGELYLIDPYLHARSSFPGPAEIVARRLVKSVARGHVRWVKDFSTHAVVNWRTAIDLLFIDGDHTYSGVRGDWDQWSGHVNPGGFIAVHDAHGDAEWTSTEDGPVRLLTEVQHEGWRLVEHVDSLAVLTRG